MKFNQDDVVYAKYVKFGKVNYIQSHVVGIIKTRLGDDFEEIFDIWYVICYNTRHSVPQIAVLREYDIKTHEEWEEWRTN